MNITDITEADEKVPLVEQCADPFVVLHTDGYYYFTYSCPEYDRIELRRAWSVKGLANARPVTVWRKHASGTMSWHIWAPELHFIDGAWYIYFAAGRAEYPWWIRTFVLMNPSADPFAGQWVEMGQIETEWDSFTLDMTTFASGGSRYAVWAQKSRDRKENSRIYIARMASPTVLELPQAELTRPEYDWERRGFKVNEGPAVLHHGGKLFLTYSASATDAAYCMGMLVADEDADLLNPSSWTKSKVPVLVTDEKRGIFGPGHNSFTTSRDALPKEHSKYDATGERDTDEDDDGSDEYRARGNPAANAGGAPSANCDAEDYLIYHARPYPEVDPDFALYDPNRHTWVRRIRYDERGWPVFQFCE